MKTIFFGTPDYVLPILKSLHKDLIAVVTQTPKPAGRDKIAEPSLVDIWAQKHKIKIIYDFNSIPKCDLGVVASYGKIIPQSVINKFKHGILNVHPSCLPEFRGASPIPATIIRGDKKSCVSIIKMDEKMDHGPIVGSFNLKIHNDDTTESLRQRAFSESANFLTKLIPDYIDKKIKPKTQNHSKATFTKLMTKQDAFIPPKSLKSAIKGNPKKAIEIERFIRAMHPWPIAWTKVNNKRLKIISAHIESKKLILDKVQLEGKNIVTWELLKEGHPTSKF